MEFEGSRTRENLQVALAGESQNLTILRQLKKHSKAVSREAAAPFEEAMNQSKELARQWFEVLNDGPVNGSLASLHEAAKRADDQWTALYHEFAAAAREEGFEQLAGQFAEASARHKDLAAGHARWLDQAHGQPHGDGTESR